MRQYLCSLKLVLILLTLHACHNKGDSSLSTSRDIGESIMNDLNQYYYTLKTMVDSDYTQHFPNILDSNNLGVLGPPTDNDSIYMLEVTNKLTEKNIVEDYKQNNIALYYASDTCLLPFQKFKSLREHIHMRFRQCLVNKYPIPNFVYSDYFDNSTQSRLSKDFSIYVLESEPYKNIADSLITNNEMLLEKWKSGFSRGVAISLKREVIIYWVIIW